MPTVPLVASAGALQRHRRAYGEIAPELGQHTEEVLLEAGFTWDEIAALRDAAAI